MEDLLFYIRYCQPYGRTIRLFFWGGGGGGRLGALYQVLPALGADHFTFDGEGGGGRFLSAQEFFFILIDKADIETM